MSALVRRLRRRCGRGPGLARGQGVPSITAIQPFQVAAYVAALSKGRSAPTAKPRLAAIRRLFDWFVVGQVMPHNPASAVRGPSTS